MIFIVNGAPGSGKTTFEEYVKKFAHCPVILLSTISYVKKVASMVGWEGYKTDQDRRFLSDLKHALGRWRDLPVEEVKREIRAAYAYFEEEPLIFVDCREPDEIRRLCGELNAMSLIIRRDSAESVPTSNLSDASVLLYQYDIQINNNGTLEELEDIAREFLEKYEKPA